MSKTQHTPFSIEKLSGRDNYSTWRFAVKTILQHEDLWNCVEAPPGGAICTDEKKMRVLDQTLF